MDRDNALSELSIPEPVAAFIDLFPQFRVEKPFERECPAGHADVIIDEFLELAAGIADGDGQKRVLIDDHRRAQLNVERGFVLEHTPNLEFVAVDGVHLAVQQTLDRCIPITRFHDGRVGKIPVREIHIGAAGNDAEPAVIFLQDRRRRAAAGFAGDRHSIEQQGMAQRHVRFGKPHTLQPVVGLGQFADADIRASSRHKIDHGIERFRIVDELDSDAERASDLLRHFDLRAEQRPIGPAHVKRRQIEARNRHPQDLGIDDRLQIARERRSRR